MKFKAILCALAATMLCACSQVENEPTDPNANGNAFVSFNVTLPNHNSRTISDATHEDGTSAENNVKSILVLLYQQDGTIAYSKNFAVADLTKSDATYTTKTWEVKKGAYKMVAIVNPLDKYLGTTPSLKELTQDASTVATASATELSTADQFVMTNALAGVPTAAPAANGDYYNDGSVYVNVDGTATTPTVAKVNVERSVAKIELLAKYADWVYTPTANTGARVKFVAYKLVNTNKSYFPIKQVQANGVNTTNDYVVDPNFTGNPTTYPALSNMFFNTFVRPTASQPFTTLAATNDPVYCLENTMTANEQMFGCSTSVVFQAIYYLTDAMTQQHVYKYLGKAYGTLAAVKAAGADVTGLTEKVYDGTEANNYTNAEISAFAAKGIVVLNGGVCYYTYQIKHISSDVNNDIMEFAVVRNNVYKLTILTVTGLGKGTNEDVPDPNTPDPGNPDTPDDNNANLSVAVTILPWTIRTNDINL